MEYYHVFLRVLDKKTNDEHEVFLFDLSKNKLKNSIVNPFLIDSSFFAKGRKISQDNITQLKIILTKDKSSDLIGRFKLYKLVENNSDKADLILDQGKDVTEIILSRKNLPPSMGLTSKQKTKPKLKNVFIIHGRDYNPVLELQKLLLEFELNPILLDEQPNKGRTILEKLERYLDVGFAFVILTPDDFGRLDSGITEVRAQNVIFEFGFFVGILGRSRVCCLLKGNTILPTDIHGLAYIHFESSVLEARQKIVEELRAAGYAPKVRRINRVPRRVK